MATGAGPHLPINVEFTDQGQWDGDQGKEDTYSQTHRRRDKHGEKRENGIVPDYPIRFREDIK